MRGNRVGGIFLYSLGLRAYIYTGDFMNKKFAEKFTAVVSAVYDFGRYFLASVNAAEIDDGFESVTKRITIFGFVFPPVCIFRNRLFTLTKTDFRVISAQKNSAL